MLRKFRGKQKDEWLYGYGYIYCHKYFDSGKAAHFLTDIYGSSQGMIVDGDTVGQCIFKLDKNKNEIYEGDILHRTKDNKNYQVSYNEMFSQYILVGKDEILSPCMLDHPEEEFEIVGNKWDNPKLIEVEQ